MLSGSLVFDIAPTATNGDFADPDRIRSTVRQRSNATCRLNVYKPERHETASQAISADCETIASCRGVQDCLTNATSDGSLLKANPPAIFESRRSLAIYTFIAIAIV